MKQIVLIASTQHSGSAFTRMLFYHLFFDQKKGRRTQPCQIGFLPKEKTFRIIYNPIDNPGNVNIYHFRKTIDKVETFLESKTRDGRILVVSFHIGWPENSFPSEAEASRLICNYPTVVPIRDPLRNIISKHARGGSKGIRKTFSTPDTTNGCCFLATLPSKPFFLTVDLLAKASVEQRRSKLLQFIEFCEAEKFNSKAFESLANEWKVYNSTSNNYARVVSNPIIKVKKNELDGYYDAQDLNSLTESMPRSMKLLKKNVSIIKPFLETLGYKNLFWW